MSGKPAVIEPEVYNEERDDASTFGIRCPLCSWHPNKHSRWHCKCGYWWNTFDTGGVCPQCLYQWTITQCLVCHQWSAHSDWYEQG